MVMHKQHELGEAHYWVSAHVTEPNYVSELKFIDAEMGIIEIKLAQRNTISIQKWGFFSHQDWRRYAHKLKAYHEQLIQYRLDVEEGMLPVKFTVYNSAELPDTGIYVKVKITNGRVYDTKKVPDRPARLDTRGKPWRIKLPRLEGFTRDSIKITPHVLKARFNGLEAHDGAVLINQVLHLHCSEDTNVTYQISSRNIAHETGLVELI